MRFQLLTASFLVLSLGSVTAQAGELNRKMVVEVDPLAPVLGSTLTSSGNSTSTYGFNVDFNLNGITTGPEMWSGTFRRNPKDPNSNHIRPEDLDPGEFYKMSATRFRWMVSKFQVPETMRGWFVRGGWSYTKITSRQTMNNDGSEGQDPVYLKDGTLPAQLESDIVDERQGIVLSFGERWAFMKNRISLSLSASYTYNFRRKISVDSEDPDAKADFEAMIEEIEDNRMSASPFPEAQLTFGYLL